MFDQGSRPTWLLQLEAREKDLREMLELRDRKTQTDELEYFVTPSSDPWFPAVYPGVGYAPC